MTVINNVTTDHHNGEEHAIGTVILFLSFGVLLACICKLVLTQTLKNKFPIPFTVVVLILGFIIGTIIAHIKVADNDFLLGEKALSEINPHLIYYIFLPLLIFDSAFNNQFYVLQPQIVSSILLAGPGVLISVGIVAVVAVYIFPYQWSWLGALMFGSVLSATDPVAVVALLHDSGASKSLAALIDLESLLNDGSAFVIFMVFRDIVIGRSNSVKKIIVNIVKFTIGKLLGCNDAIRTVSIVGGPAFGLACSIIAVIVLNHVNNKLEVEILSTFGLAYLIFYVADVELGVSAVLALVVMGLFMAKHKYCISSHVQYPMIKTWHIVIEFANILIFLITGIILAHSLLGTKITIVSLDFLYSIILYLALHVGRLLSVVILYPCIRWSGVDLSWKEYMVLTWSGLRGSMSVILALIVASDNQIDVTTRHRFLFHVCMIALLTLIINGTSSKFLVRLLGLDRGTPESEIILLQALEHMRKRTSNRLHRVRKEKQFSDVDWNMLNEYLPEKLIEEIDSQQMSNISRRFTLTSDSLSYPKTTTTDVDSKGIPSILETDYVRINLTSNSPVIFDQESDHNKLNKNLENEITIRLLTVLSADYEKQWYRGMLRRRTLYILIKSVEQAKHQHSLNLHWKLILDHLYLSKWLLTLMRFDNVDWIKKHLNKLLFDHIFLTMELILAFHSAQNRLDNIQVEFPELTNIDERIWGQIMHEMHLHHLTATYILLDLQQSYNICWRIHMTKRCAQMLLKYESHLVKELYETGILGETEHSHISGLIERKLFQLEFHRVRLPEGQLKAIENPFDLLQLFRSLPDDQKENWRTIINSKHRWFQPGDTLLKEGQRVLNAYLIARGVVQCQIDTMPIYYRSGNIIGIDVLFAQNFTMYGAFSPDSKVEKSYSINALFSQSLTAYGTYSVCGGLLEAYPINAILLNQILDDDNLAPSIYQEIALHLLSYYYQSRLKTNRLQLKSILHKRSKFFWKQPEESIQFQENQRLFILSGYVMHLSNDQNNKYDAIQLKIFDTETQIMFNPSTVAYSWTDDDEIFFDKDTHLAASFSTPTFASISSDLFYPGYPSRITDDPERRHSESEARHRP